VKTRTGAAIIAFHHPPPKPVFVWRDTQITVWLKTLGLLRLALLKPKGPAIKSGRLG